MEQSPIVIQEYIRKDFTRLLKNGALEGRRWMNATDSSAVRIYDRNLEFLPVTVELYGKYAKIVDYADGGLDDDTRDEVIDLVNRMVYIERDRIVYQRRKKREGLEQHGLVSDQKVELVVKEHGLDFIVDLSSHIDTGLFLDLALVREYVRTMSRDRKVLNLFSYTGSFSVYAAAGGAESVTSVDMANTYSQTCRKNLENNGFLDEKRFPVVVQDATVFVKEAVEKGEVYDIIIFDPPSFSNSNKMERPFDVKKDYLEWMASLSRLMGEHGILIFSCNSSTFTLEKGLLKKSFKINEIGQGLFPVGFSRSRGTASRVWQLEKLALFDVPKNSRKKGEKVKRVEDGDFDRLVSSMDEETEEREMDRRPSYRSDRKPSYRRDDERRPSFRREDGDRSFERRSYRRDDEDRPRYRRDDERRDYQRPSYREDGGRSHRDDDRRPSFRRDEDRRSSYRRDEGRRPFYRDEDRRPSYRRNDDSDRKPFHRDDERRPSYGRRDDERKPYWKKDGDAPRSRAQSHSYDRERRRKNSVKPYGYDNFKKSRDRSDGEEE